MSVDQGFDRWERDDQKKETEHDKNSFGLYSSTARIRFMRLLGGSSSIALFERARACTWGFQTEVDADSN